ncbi:MAG: ketoacyl-ACP synthase III [Desulfatibacillum sp.]|nr:ketoacyl-ACP synthase III [Desulfatibacillum sp.]
MLYVHGMGHYHPENVITNRFLSDLDIGSDEKWIMERVGIEERRTTLDLDYIRLTLNRDPRDAAQASICTRAWCGAQASQMALDRAGLKKEDLGLVISGSSSPLVVCPAEAATIAAELGLEVPCFDINSACSTFIVQLGTLASMRLDTLPRFVLVVNLEHVTHSVDYSDRNSAPLFGDGAAAAVVSMEESSPLEFFGAEFFSIPGSWDKAVIPQGGHFYQEGRAVQGYAIRKTTDSLKHLQSKYGPEAPRMRFVGHQANYMMLSHVAQRCGIEDADHWHSVREFGNTGCSGAPSVLSQNWDNLMPGDHVAMVVVGGGLTYGHAMLQAAGLGEQGDYYAS